MSKIRAKIKWSLPIEIFQPGKYNTDEKFIKHLRKFISENDSPLLDEKGFFMFLAGQVVPEEKLSIVLVEGTFEQTIKEKILKKKGHIREYRCIYENHKNENLYLKIGIIEELNEKDSEELYQAIACKYIQEINPNCNEPCEIKFEKEIEIQNSGEFSPLKEKI